MNEACLRRRSIRPTAAPQFHSSFWWLPLGDGYREMARAGQGGEEVQPSRCRARLTAAPSERRDHHRGIDAEVFAASAGVGGVVVRN